MAMSISITSEIEAPIERVWEVLSDVESWPKWTTSMELIEALDGSDLQVGNRFRVKQPRFAPAIYVVRSVTPGVAFEWDSYIPGARTHADHRLSSCADGTEVSLSFSYHGILGSILGVLLLGMTRRYLQTEIIGLATTCENA
jgi:uncharacterized protein YndB with AHSA1/START domain